jgi:DNA polymerase III psi subunit
VALSTQALGFFFDASEASQENIEFLNSILKGMNIEFSKVLMTSRFEDFHSGIQNMICFGAAAPQNVSGPYKIFESLSPSQLKTNVSEKKKLWNQLKAWTPHL